MACKTPSRHAKTRREEKGIRRPPVGPWCTHVPHENIRARTRTPHEDVHARARAHTHTHHDFHERAAIFDHTLRGALSPPHTSRAPEFVPECDIRMPRRQRLRHGGHFGKPFKEGVPGLQRGPRAAPPRPTYSIFRSDYHLPAMDSADRRLRPVHAHHAHAPHYTYAQERT